jgi:TetR/AcrR family transcriptional regulator, repressor for uid operon
MATPTRRSDKAAATRARILTEAIKVLEMGGDDAVKVLEIAAAAQVSTGSIYHHFDGRDGLVIEARLQQFRAALPEDLAAIEWAVDHAQTVDEFRECISQVSRLAHSASRAANRRTRADVISAGHMHPALAEALADEQHRHAEAVTAAIARAQDRGLVAPDLPPHVVAILFMGIAFGVLLGDLDTHRPIDTDEWHQVIDLLIDKVLTGHAAPG